MSSNFLLRHAPILAALGLLHGCDAHEVTTGAFALDASTLAVLQLGELQLPAEAVERMRAEQKYGLVFVVPSDPERRETLGRLLEDVMLTTEAGLVSEFMTSPTWHVRFIWLATLTEFVVSCVPVDQAPGDNGARALLVSPQGEVVAERTLSLSASDDFILEVRELCSQEPAATQRAATVDEAELERFEQTLANWDDADYGSYGAEYEEALANFSEQAAACLPAMSNVLGNPQHEAWSVLDRAFWYHPFSGWNESEGCATTIIHGVDWKYEGYDPCPLCGMAYVPSSKRVFDHFLDE